MSNYTKTRQKILIADDSRTNRALLINMLENEYDLVEVENGAEAVAALQEEAEEFSLLLLGIEMPEMDGFEVLAFMNKYRWIDDIPVIMISDESSSACMERAYDFGVTDFISRPFDAVVVRRRVENTMLLAARQRRLTNIVAEQIYEKEKSDKLMISILSHIVEFRNGESGMHVLHINTITEMLLKKLMQMTDRYPLTQSDINRICMASSLHDIGKIAIPGEVLNKPGRLTAEEFEIMKGHSETGARMLSDLPIDQKNEPLVKVAYEICRWHHERYDGGGYPDHLKGDEIPISAQVVSLADVYDALTSERCYKKAFSHEQSMEMILGGQCGAFNPLLLDCLREIGEALRHEMSDHPEPESTDHDMKKISEQIRNYDLTSAERVLQHRELERQQTQFLASTATEPIFRYTVSPPLLTLNEAGAALFGAGEAFVNPFENEKLHSYIRPEAVEALRRKAAETTPEHPTVTMDIQIRVAGQDHWFRCILRTLWFSDDHENHAGSVGRLVDVQEAHKEMEEETEIAFGNRMKLGLAGSQNLLREGYRSMTGVEARAMIRELHGIFDFVRLVDAGVNRQVTISDEGELHHTTYCCYGVWNRKERCENCISAKCLCSQNRQGKFEFVNEDIYFVLAIYVEVDGNSYSLEMVSKITDETMLGGTGREELVEYITEHNQKLHLDPVTSVYNRRYYEEQLAGVRRAKAVAMLDVDQFKEINDTYGHQTGDQALVLIAEAIRSCVRSTDAVVRYGGDEFVIVFRDIPKHVFERKLEEIQQSVSSIRVPSVPGLRLSLSVGGVYSSGKIADMLNEADTRMYRAKREKKRRMKMAAGTR
jgi:putative two-component system response regulator